jgi:hypothetical protein
MKTEQIRFRIPSDDVSEIRKISEAFGIQTTDLASIFLRAAVSAIKENGGSLPLPLCLRVETKTERKK